MKKVDEKQPTTRERDGSPTVEILNITKPIGTAGQEESPYQKKPEYTEPYRNSRSRGKAPTVEKPEYTKPIGTAGRQEITVEKPE